MAKIKKNILPIEHKPDKELEILQIENENLRKQISSLNYLSDLSKIAEEKYHKFFEEDLTGDFISDGEGTILDCNKSFLDIFGYSHKSELIGKDITIVYNNKNDFELIKEHLKKSKIIRNLEGERIKKDGTIITVIVNLVASIDTENEITEIKGFVFDISDRKHLEKELLKAKEKAEESDRLKSAFLANMSHEIRTPMNAIVGFASFLKNKEKSKEDIERYSDIIINSGNHLLNLINDIIDISKIDANQVKLVYTTSNINNLLFELYVFFQSQITARNKTKLQLFYNTPKKDLIIYTDETRLRQILINLIGNAIKFTSEGFIEFGYRIQENKILLYVKDTGIGIHQENQSIIFERFKQAAESTEKFYGGTGLGLSIAKACVELLGGNIWLESCVGKGTTFYFTIDFNPCEITTKLPEIVEINKIKFDGEHILIAEDDEINFQYLNEIFKNQNVKISHTRNGKETFDFIINTSDLMLVVMDIQLPEMNGWEITRSLRKLNYNIPVIALTAYAFDSDKLESFNAGCNAFLSKPTKAEEIINIVYNHIKKIKVGQLK